jgi:hypothetical protein
MKLGLPSGVGDCSWAVSKLINAPEWPEIEFEIADGWPFRTAPYFEMLGKKATYGQFHYDDIIAFENYNPYKTWENIRSKGYGCYLIQPNQHLEAGKPLHEWLPDLETSYHYPLAIPDLKASRRYSKCFQPLEEYPYWVGISAASYRGSKAWNTWELDSWADLCLRLIADGYHICLMGGKWDDLTDELEFHLPVSPDQVLNIVGKTTFPEACAVHRLCKFYIGFSSGLGIIRSVMGLPTIMLWPDHQQKLSTSWADPEDLYSGKYIACGYTKPSSIYKTFIQQEASFRKEEH